MKTLLILLICVSFYACSKPCDEDKVKLSEKYQQDLQYAQGNEAAINDLTMEYNNRLANLNCD